MNRLLILFLMVALMVGCGDGKKPKNVADNQEVAVESQNEEKVAFPIYDFEGLEPLLHKEDGKTYIINFWATWCKPCIEEMPHFERIHAEQKDKGVEVILVNLDMPNMWKTRLEPFVEKKGIRSKVVILDDPKQNDWIPKVSEEWGGGIPATLIYNKDKRSFFEQGFTYEELNSTVQTFIK